MILSSLRNRIFLTSALLAVLSIAAVTYYATAAVTAQAEAELRRNLDEAGTLVEEYRTLLLDHFSREARLVADLPVLKAAVSENHPPTVHPDDHFRDPCQSRWVVLWALFIHTMVTTNMPIHSMDRTALMAPNVSCRSVQVSYACRSSAVPIPASR